MTVPSSTPLCPPLGRVPVSPSSLYVIYVTLYFWCIIKECVGKTNLINSRKMKPNCVFISLSVLSSAHIANGLCTASQKCWPSASTWSAFNTSINGRLVAPRPPAWPCHNPNYDEAACTDVKANWFDPFWRSNQAGAMQDLVWESMGCEVDSPRNLTCKQGYVPTYSVAAIEVEDVSKAVEFAGKYSLRLVVKNTGHD